MLINAKELEEQLTGDIDAKVREAYLTLAQAQLPEGMTARPASHGFIARELRFEADGKWLFSGVLNQKWVLWYFRRPAYAAGLVQAEPTIARFPEAKVAARGEIKLRLFTKQEAVDVLQWIGATPLS